MAVNADRGLGSVDLPGDAFRFVGLTPTPSAAASSAGDLDPAEPVAQALSTLLTSTAPRGTTAEPTLWSAEAIHRANNLAQLAVALSRRSCEGTRAGDIGQHAAALAAVYASISRANGRPRQCTGLLCDLVTRLVALFGPEAGTVGLHIEQMSLALTPARVRALALTTSELVINALRHAFPGSRSGLIHLSLLRVDTGWAELRVRDDGVGRPSNPMTPGQGTRIVEGLAAELDGLITYASDPSRGTTATLRFPTGILTAPLAHYESRERPPLHNQHPKLTDRAVDDPL